MFLILASIIHINILLVFFKKTCAFCDYLNLAFHGFTFIYCGIAKHNLDFEEK